MLVSLNICFPYLQRQARTSLAGAVLTSGFDQKGLRVLLLTIQIPRRLLLHWQSW